ncbi:MAG: hypothetical protein HY790_06080 [Deltaproteobacteria bacterium]|nr:hypothetical protein [Deltaproteobacteria bacterium]MBI4795395.1 hypothetical protein [Deltaproteobacteria bacterium]
MANKKFGGKKPRKAPLAAVIAKHFAKRGPAPFLPNQVNKAPDEKERRCTIAIWQCFYLNNILIKCAY